MSTKRWEGIEPSAENKISEFLTGYGKLGKRVDKDFRRLSPSNLLKDGLTWEEKNSPLEYYLMNNCLFLILLTLLPQLAMARELHLLVNYYDGLGQKMRTETVVRYQQDCSFERVAEVVLIDSTNEIREAAFLNEKGWWVNQPVKDSVGMKNIVSLFKQASFKKAKCLIEKQTDSPIENSMTDDELVESIRSAIRPMPVTNKNISKEKLE